MLQLQAHRGVCTEYPENTMSAFYGAVYQDYNIIELDPSVTSDGVFVILHDDTIERTARRADGTQIEETRKITEMAYEEAAAYEYGSWFSPKFAGEKLPLLQEVLMMAKKHQIQLKLDNKIWKIPQKYMEDFWKLLKEADMEIGVTCDNLERVKESVRKLPKVQIHYDGPITEMILKELKQSYCDPVVWVPVYSKDTAWANVTFASKEFCKKIKEYARLGIWILSDYEIFDEVCEQYHPDVVETPGQIKPVKNQGRIVDMHTHSEHSHDSECPIRDMAQEEIKHGTYGFAVTDHCDMRACERKDVTIHIKESVKDAENLREEYQQKENPTVQIFSGVELGESIWYPQVRKQLLQSCDYDVVIGSAHVVIYKEYDKAYSRIDFSETAEEELYGFLEKYLDDVLKTVQIVPCDIAAHLLCPLRYINGKYGRNIDGKRLEGKIREILKVVIRQGIALEINTSCMQDEDVDWFEQDWLLGVYKEMGGFLVTIGSDAHVCENAARKFDRAVALLRKHGFRNCFYYKKRKSIQCTI